MKSRVVFIPGILGSVLVDDKLDANLSLAQDVCEQNLDYLLSGAAEGLGEILFEDATPCKEPHNPAVVWGEYGMLHWLFNTEEWVQRISRGNGIDQPWNIIKRTRYGLSVSRARNEGLLKFEIKARRLGKLVADLLAKDLEEFNVDPYGDFLQRFNDRKKIDLLVFPYDWRLSNAYNATILAEKIRHRWWGKIRLNDINAHSIPEDEKITIVAHSMGGLIARFYIEADYANLGYIKDPRARKVPLAGHRFVRQLITVGTPHLGVPEAYLTYIGAMPLEMQSALLKFLREQLYLPKLFDLAVKVERGLIERRTKVPTPDVEPVAKDSPEDSGVVIKQWELQIVIERLSSLIEMFPAYKFMPTEQFDPKGGLELLDLDTDPQELYEWYIKWTTSKTRGKQSSRHRLFHPAFGRNIYPWQMFSEFRKKLIPPDCLDQWLMLKGLHYRCVGEVDDITITGYNPKSDKIEKKNTGDSVVPWNSAILDPWSANGHHLHGYLFKADDARRDHQTLLQKGPVLDCCAYMAFYRESCQQKSSKMRLVPVNKLDNVNLLVKKILWEAGFKSASVNNRAVISLITVQFDNPDDEGIIPFFDPGKGIIDRKVFYERDMPWEGVGPTGLGWTIEYTHKHQTIGKRRIIGIAAREKTYANIELGGVIFLPETKCQDYLEIITWNLGDKQTLDNKVTNDTHAEFQFADWFGNKFYEWFEARRKRLGWKTTMKAIEIQNKGYDKYSPCSQCLGDLRKIGKSLGGTRKEPVGKISWGKIYNGKAGPTYKDELVDTEKAGWQIDENSPRPNR